MAEEQIKFDNQEFLSSYIEEIMDKLYSDSVSPFTYKNIYRLNTSNDSLPVSIAKFTGKTESVSFNRMKSYQYASLVPKIRLFRVQGIGQTQKEYEYVFGKGAKYLASSDNAPITDTPKGQNCGIVSVEYKLAGTNPVTAERSIEVVLELYFDSINAFSGGDYDKMFKFWKSTDTFNVSNDFDNNSNNTTINYWSLIMHPSNKKGNRDRYSPENYRIKAVVGWEDLEPFLQNELFGDLPSIKEDIQDTNLSMILQLNAHNFTFNEDGSIGLRIEYVASLENILATKKFNLFNGLKESIEEIKNRFIIGSNTNTLNEKENLLKLLQYIKANNGDLSKLERELDTDCYKEAGLTNEAKDKLKQTLASFKNSNQNAIDSLINQQNEELKKITESVNRSILSIKYEYYSKLSNKLLEIGSIKTLQVDKDTANKWLQYRNKKPSSNKPALTPIVDNTNDSNNQELKQAEEKRKEVQEKAEKENTPEESGLLEGIGNWFSSLGNDSSEPATDTEQVFTEILFLNFTTVGSIIDAAYEVLLENDPTEAEDINRNKVILSAFSEELVSTGNGGSITRNVADIPISISKLTEFLLKNIEEPQKDSYTLKEMLRDIMSQLIESSLNSRTYGETEENKYSNTSLAFNTLTLKGIEDPMNNFKIENSPMIVTTFGKTKKDMKQFYPNSKLSNNESYYNYFLMYDKYLKDFRGSGIKQQDEQLGIYHFSIGQDRGLLKKVAFKRVDQPGLRESKSLGKETLFLGQFRDRYNADLTLVGNNIFIPGMLVFVVPSVEIGNPADPDSFSELTGLGGYYTVISVNTTISQGDYTTTLDCIFHSARQSRTDKGQLNKNATCVVNELEKAGFLNPDGQVSGILRDVNALSESYKDEQKIQIREELRKVINEKIKESRGDTVTYNALITARARLDPTSAKLLSLNEFTDEEVNQYLNFLKNNDGSTKQ